MDITVGIKFIAFDSSGTIYKGNTLDFWKALPNSIVLVDVEEAKKTNAGKSYHWLMECEWFGCREHPNGLEFQRYHETNPPIDFTWNWKQGLLIPDDLMNRIRKRAFAWHS